MKFQLPKRSHFSRNKITEVSNREQQDVSLKPRGLWYQLNECLSDWEEREEMNLFRGFVYNVKINDKKLTVRSAPSKDKILVIKSLNGVKKFSKKYSYKNFYEHLNFKKIKKHYDVIIFDKFAGNKNIDKKLRMMIESYLQYDRLVERKQGGRELRLNTEEELQNFYDKYWVISSYIHIDWKAVSEDYAGIEVKKYNSIRKNFSLRNPNRDKYLWFLSWDFSSGCIWRVSAIDGVEYLGKKEDITFRGNHELC